MEKDELTEGMELTLTKAVKKEDTAEAYASGSLPVFATPAMISLKENVSLNLVKTSLRDGYDTVGTHVDVKHLKATCVGQTVKCTARLVKKNGPKLTFEVEAWDETGKIGVGTHKRYIVEKASFLNNIK